MESVADLDHEAHALVDRATRPGGLQPVFQPIVRLADGAVVGYEALSRFPFAGSGPEECFARAMEVGRAVELEEAALRAIGRAGSPPAGELLFVNVSPAALADPRVQQLRGDLPDRLVLEVTERDAVDDYDELRAHLGCWTSNGVRLAVDDTGSGYASMRHAIQLLPEFLKLDRTLINGVDRDRMRQALVRSLVTFAREVGATVIAEGVETARQLRWLRESDVTLAQGYLFARPGPPWPAAWTGRVGRRVGAARPAAARLRQRLEHAHDARAAANAVVDHLFRRGDVMPSVYLEEDGRLRCYAQRGLWQVLDGMSPEAGITGLAFLTGECQVVPDVRRSAEYLQAIPGVKAEVCVPILVDDIVVGALNADCTSRLANDLTDDLQTVAELLGARLAKLGPRARRVPLRALMPTLTPLVSSTSRDDTLTALLAGTREACGFDSVMIALIGQNGLAPVAAAGPLAATLRDTRCGELDKLADLLTLLTSCYSTGESAGRALVGTEALRQSGARAMAAVPLFDGERRLGMIIVANTDPHPLSPDELEGLELIGMIAGSSLASVDEAEALRSMVTSDALTGIGNQGAFYQLLEQPSDSARALILLDIDRFKDVNDSRGHPFGDQVLREVGLAISDVTRRRDLVFRIGGDEFAVVFDDLDDDLDLARPVSRVDWAVKKVLDPFDVTASLGAAWIPCHEAGSGAFEHADTALYEAKRAARCASRSGAPAVAC